MGAALNPVAAKELAVVAPESVSVIGAAGVQSVAPTPAFRIVKVTKRGGDLSKTIIRNDDGSLTVDASACAMTKGEARSISIVDGMAGLAKLYLGLKSNEAVVFSNVDLGPQPRPVCTESEYAEERKRNPVVITRSRKFLDAISAPGLQLFEVDDHGLPAGSRVPDGNQMLAILCELLPELDVHAAARMLTHSTSSHIYESKSGTQLKGEGGKHLAILLSDPSKAKALRELLEVRQWALGYGHIYISRDGKQLERTVFDLSVFAPERLVFEAGALLPPGLEQRRPAAEFHEGNALDMSKLPAPTPDERERAQQAKDRAKAATRQAATETRARYLEDETQKLVRERGLDPEAARRAVTTRSEANCLSDADILCFTDTADDRHSVANVLDHIEQFVGRPMRDPIEPEKGRSKAMILRGPGGLPYISSFAHGGRRFTFERIVGQQGAVQSAMMPHTDLANAHRLVKAFGNDLIATSAGWFVFNGRHWERGEHLAEAKALNLSRLVLGEPAFIALLDRLQKNDFKSDKERDEVQSLVSNWHRFAAKCESKSTITAALQIARTLLWRDVSDLNANPWLLNVLNGTLDLRTGSLRAHDRDDLITAMAPVEFHPDAQAPIFERALHDMMDGDQEVVRFIQRFFGYSLTGVTVEQKILIPWGDGSNGKSTILNVVQQVMGRDYCGSAAPKLLEASKSDRHPTEIADLYGKRLVIASETEEGAQLREAFLKLATGSDPLKGRFMRQDFFEFVATHKFVLLTNHKPAVSGTDHAIWRRLLLVPFEVIFGDDAAIAAGEARRKKDKDLPANLARELEGILTWMIRGCLEWQKIGLAEPAKVRGATDVYREEQDRIGQFVAEEAEVGSGKCVLQSDLYLAYRQWCSRNGYHQMGHAKFRKQLLKALKGKVTAGRTTSGPKKNVATYVGIWAAPSGSPAF